MYMLFVMGILPEGTEAIRFLLTKKKEEPKPISQGGLICYYYYYITYEQGEQS